MKTVPNVRDERGRAVELQEVGAVDVAELGRHEAVDQPRQEQDLGSRRACRPGSPRRAGGAPSESRAAGSRRRRSRKATSRSNGFAARTAATSWSTSTLSATRKTSTSSTIGTARLRIVRGWRRRLPSESWSASSASRRRRSLVGRRDAPSWRTSPALGPHGGTRPLPRARWSSLANGVITPAPGRWHGRAAPGPWPAPRRSPGRRGRVADQARRGDPDLEDRVRVGDRHSGQSRAQRERLGALVAVAEDDPRVVRLDPVHEPGQRLELRLRAWPSSCGAGRTGAGSRPARPARGPARSSPPATAPAGRRDPGTGRSGRPPRS